MRAIPIVVEYPVCRGAACCALKAIRAQQAAPLHIQATIPLNIATLFPILLLLATLSAGCQPKAAETPSVSTATHTATTTSATPKFEDVTAKAGIDWTHNPCRTGKKFLPETVGGGGGFLEYNRDGKLDILLINGAPLPGYKGPTPKHALYRNNGDGTFTDVTTEAGLDFSLYGIGAAVADYDNDGWPDIFLTAVGHTRLLHNVQGKFVDVTAKSGVDVTGFTTGATWLDYDRDGKLDLYVGRYVEWTPETDLPCGPPDARQYCAPNQYKGAPPMLFHNRGNGVFENVSQKMGVLGHSSKTLAAVPYDFNHDGWVDIFLANDTEPDVLLINQQGKTFTDQALESGIALGADGRPTGSMGVDIATPFADTRIGVAIGVFAGQQLSLFVSDPNSEGVLLFENRQQESRVALPTIAMTTFGLVFADVDLDGWPDLMIANGHIDDDQALSAGGHSVAYRQPPQLFQNRQDETFADVPLGAELAKPLVGRGLAVGDYDNDGKPDFLVFENGGPVRLWHNITETKNNWLGIELIGASGSSDGTGAMVTVYEKGRTQTRCATTARSYLSVCDPRLLFGIPIGQVEKVTVQWPDGKTSTVDRPALNGYLKVTR